jgi:hypothetical protein
MRVTIPLETGKGSKINHAWMACRRSAGMAAAVVALGILTGSCQQQPRAEEPTDHGGYRPQYQGFGIDTEGGRGGVVCRVTSLNDRQPPVPGTLRYCLESVHDRRFVIFEISGTIALRSGPLRVVDPYVTIAGQTAPSPGILVRGPGLVVDTHDGVIQHIRVRVGNIAGDPIGLWFRDDATRVVADHVSVSWAIWDGMAVSAYHPGHPTGDITIIDSIVSESLACNGVSTTAKCDPRTYPARGATNSRGIAIGDDWHHGSARVAIVRTISAHNNDRHPEIQGGTVTLLVNNLIYNPSQTPLSAILYEDGNNVGPAYSMVLGNVLRAGPTTPGYNGYRPAEYPEEGDVMLVRVDPSFDADSRVFLQGNYDEQHCHGTSCLDGPDAQWMLAKDFKREWDGISIRATEPPFEVPSLSLSSVLPYTEVEPTLTRGSGARPLDRDVVDARIVEEIRTRTGSVPNRTSEKAGVGTSWDGFPVLQVNRRPLHPPDDGNAVIDGVGRTRMELWLEQYAAALEPR